MFELMDDFLLKICERNGDKTAYCWVNDDGSSVSSVSFKRFVSDAFKAAGYFQQTIGTHKKTHIAIVAKNCYEYVVSFVAILMTGNVAVPLNNALDDDTLNKTFVYTDCDYVICDGANGARDFYLPKIAITGFYGSEALFVRSDEVCADDLAVLLMTSGTTGKNKCVMISQKKLFKEALFAAKALRDINASAKKSSKSLMVVLPLYHVASLSSVFNALVSSYTANICKEMQHIMRDLKLMPTDHILAVPMLLDSWVKMIKAGRKGLLNGLFMITSVGATLDEETVEFMENNDFYMSGFYGMTESFGGGLYNNYFVSRKFGSIGIPGEGVEAKIIDDEICIKAEFVMMGYYKDEAETGLAIKDGWLHTGDLGRIDEDGYVYLTGRKKNLIILANGENVIPEEIEAVIAGCEFVKEVIVKEKDKKICAEVYCAEDKQESVEVFIRECNRTLPTYKRVGLVEFRSSAFERTSSGKIKR